MFHLRFLSSLVPVSRLSTLFRVAIPECSNIGLFLWKFYISVDNVDKTEGRNRSTKESHSLNRRNCLLCRTSGSVTACHHNMVWAGRSLRTLSLLKGRYSNVFRGKVDWYQSAFMYASFFAAVPLLYMRSAAQKRKSAALPQNEDKTKMSSIQLQYIKIQQKQKSKWSDDFKMFMKKFTRFYSTEVSSYHLSISSGTPI